MGGIEHEYDRMIEEAIRIKNQGYSKDGKIKLDLILSVNEAVWVSRRIYDDIDKGLLTADFKIKSSAYSVEMTIVLSFLTGSVISPFATKVANRLADDLMNFLERKSKRVKRKTTRSKQ